MRLGLISRRSGRRWWWMFALLIAGPALALALLGLRVAQLEGLERAQQTREQRAQLARLADTAVGTMLGAMQSELSRNVRSPSAAQNYIVFILEPGGRLLFPYDKIYFPDPGKPDLRSGPKWTKATEQLIENAQTADQQPTNKASLLFQQVPKTEPRLRAWAEMALARHQFESGDTSALTNLTNPLWSRSDGLTPTRLPVALLAAAYVEGVPPAQRTRFVPLLRATLDGLRAGRWWFSFEERRFYDGELRRLLELAGAQPPSEDSRLADWASIERLARRARPSGSPSDVDSVAPFFLLWSRAPTELGWARRSRAGI